MATVKELTAIVEQQAELIAQLTKRIEALEARKPSPAASTGITKHGDLIAKVPLDTPVERAVRTEQGFYLVINGERRACTEYCARWWHKRLQAA